MKTKSFFQFEIIINVFPAHLNTYVMGLWPLEIILLARGPSFLLTSDDGPRTERIKFVVLCNKCIFLSYNTFQKHQSTVLGA